MSPTKRSAIALARAPHRCLDDVDIDRVNSGSYGRNRTRRAGVVEIHEQVAGQLGQPGTDGLGGDAENVHAAGGVLDDETRPATGSRPSSRWRSHKAH
jgi:hypothetical protein